jgi:hypothetical protein
MIVLPGIPVPPATVARRLGAPRRGPLAAGPSAFKETSLPVSEEAPELRTTLAVEDVG